jgi:hypothetical protein
MKRAGGPTTPGSSQASRTHDRRSVRPEPAFSRSASHNGKRVELDSAVRTGVAQLGTNLVPESPDRTAGNPPRPRRISPIQPNQTPVRAIIIRVSGVRVPPPASPLASVSRPSAECPAVERRDARWRCRPSWRGRRRDPLTGRPEWQKPVVRDRSEVLRATRRSPTIAAPSWSYMEDHPGDGCSSSSAIKHRRRRTTAALRPLGRASDRAGPAQPRGPSGRCAPASARGRGSRLVRAVGLEGRRRSRR